MKRIALLCIPFILFTCAEDSDPNAESESPTVAEENSDTILTPIDSIALTAIDSAELEIPVQKWCDAQVYTEENHEPEYEHNDQELGDFDVDGANTLMYTFSKYYPQLCGDDYGFKPSNCASVYDGWIYDESLEQAMSITANVHFDSIQVSSYATAGLSGSAKDAREATWGESSFKYLHTPDIDLVTAYDTSAVSFEAGENIPVQHVKALKSVRERVKGLDGTMYEIAEWVVSLHSIHFKFVFYKGYTAKEVNIEFNLLHGGC